MQDLRVEECSKYVLSTIIEFMYGSDLPWDLSMNDATSLLAMADMYLMEDLKDSVAPIIEKQVTCENILEISKLAVTHKANRLIEMCCNFILTNPLLSEEQLDELLLVLPVIGKRALKISSLATNILGVDTFTFPFQSRKDFESDDSYPEYVKSNIRPNMLVRCNESFTIDAYSGKKIAIQEGMIGHVASFDDTSYESSTQLDIKWPVSPSSKRIPSNSILFLDIITPPIESEIFSVCACYNS